MDESTLKNAQAGAIQAREGLFRYSMRQFLAALIILVLTYPFVVELENGDLMENILMMVLLISAVLAVGIRSWVLTILLVIPAMAGPWLDLYWHGIVPGWIITGTHVVFVGFVVGQLLRFILKATRVDSEVMCAGISAYLMLGIMWTPTYLMISELSPGSFSGIHLAANQSLSRFDAFYLSFVTLTTLGCNDITPLSKIARMLLMVESLTGVLFLGVLIARLVALYSNPGQAGRDGQTRV
jgi:Ion channel